MASMWRYADGIAGGDALDWPAVSLGEGGTPLVEAKVGRREVALKLEYVSPTGSFKDRGAVVLVALARLLGAERLVADSSGNAGTSIAAYAARAGMEAEIFVPASASEKKLLQVRAHGAKVTAIQGTREETALAAIERVTESGAFYASHVYNPYFLEGIKTYAFELFEELGEAPATVVLPAGNGTLVLGVHRGFRELTDAGIIGQTPRIVAVQARTCAPLASAFESGLSRAEVGPTGRTVAEGIAIAEPARSDEILAAVEDSGGSFVTVADDEIDEARGVLARQGFWVEPTGAVAYAAILRLEREGRLGEGLVSAPLCGSGLKTTV